MGQDSKLPLKEPITDGSSAGRSERLKEWWGTENGTDGDLGKEEELGGGGGRVSVRTYLVNRVVNISAVTAECGQLAWQ